MKLNLRVPWHRAFQTGIVLKGLDGILELSGGLGLIFTSQPAIRRLVAFLTHDELIEDPHDFVANLLVRLTQHLSIQTQHFAGIYLLGHGVIKVGLAVGLLRGVSWSYPAALLFLTAFVAYQLYRIVYSHSPTLSFVTAFDLTIVALIWHEWRRRKERFA